MYRRMLMAAAIFVGMTALAGCVVLRTDKTVIIEPSYSHVRDGQAAPPAQVSGVSEVKVNEAERSSRVDQVGLGE